MIMTLNLNWAWTVRILRRCEVCGTEFCDWKPNTQWASDVVQADLALAAYPYLRCNVCSAIRVIQIGDAEIVNARP